MWKRREPLLTHVEAGRVRRVLFLNGMPVGEIEDAMQEIELRALERPPKGLARGAWACAVATNLAMDQHRRVARGERAFSMFDPGRSVGGSEGAELRDVVRRGLERLAPELRAAVVLRFYADFEVSEIAEAMRVPEGTVKSRLHRAVAELRAVLPKESLR
jgi:RNA polymerase sigma-70 factor, ECF subfamily